MTVRPVRLLLDQAAPQTVTDIYTNQGPVLWRGYDWEIDYGIGLSGLLQTTNLATIASLTLQLFQKQNDTNAPMVQATSTIANAGLTQAQWSNNTTPFFHGNFIIANSLTAISLNGQASVSYWLKIFATTTDATAKLIPLQEGAVTVNDGPISVLSPPTAPGWKIVTDNGAQTIAILDPVTGNYYALEIDTVAGVRSLSLGDTAY